MMEMIFLVCFVTIIISSANVEAGDVGEPWSTYEERRISIMEALSEDSICGSCLEISRKAQQTLNDPKLFQGIAALSSEVCHAFPSDLNAKCLEMSEMYINHSRWFLQQLFHEKNLCNSTGLCAERSIFSIDENFSSSSSSSSSSSMNLMKLKDNKSCITCRNSVKEILAKIKLPNMKRKIKDALLEYCEEAEDNEEQCKQAIYKYAPSVLQKIETLKPSDMCRIVGLCDEGVSL